MVQAAQSQNRIGLRGSVNNQQVAVSPPQPPTRHLLAQSLKKAPDARHLVKVAPPKLDIKDQLSNVQSYINKEFSDTKGTVSLAFKLDTDASGKSIVTLIGLDDFSTQILRLKAEYNSDVKGPVNGLELPDYVDIKDLKLQNLEDVQLLAQIAKTQIALSNVYPAKITILPIETDGTKSLTIGGKDSIAFTTALNAVKDKTPAQKDALVELNKLQVKFEAFTALNGQPSKTQVIMQDAGTVALAFHEKLAAKVETTALNTIDALSNQELDPQQKQDIEVGLLATLEKQGVLVVLNSDKQGVRLIARKANDVSKETEIKMHDYLREPLKDALPDMSSKQRQQLRQTIIKEIKKKITEEARIRRPALSHVAESTSKLAIKADNVIAAARTLGKEVVFNPETEAFSLSDTVGSVVDVTTKENKVALDGLNNQLVKLNDMLRKLITKDITTTGDEKAEQLSQIMTIVGVNFTPDPNDDQEGSHLMTSLFLYGLQFTAAISNAVMGSQTAGVQSASMPQPPGTDVSAYREPDNSVTVASQMLNSMPLMPPLPPASRRLGGAVSNVSFTDFSCTYLDPELSAQDLAAANLQAIYDDFTGKFPNANPVCSFTPTSVDPNQAVSTEDTNRVSVEAIGVLIDSDNWKLYNQTFSNTEYPTYADYLEAEVITDVSPFTSFASDGEYVDGTYTLVAESGAYTYEQSAYMSMKLLDGVVDVSRQRVDALFAEAGTSEAARACVANMLLKLVIDNYNSGAISSFINQYIISTDILSSTADSTFAYTFVDGNYYSGLKAETTDTLNQEAECPAIMADLEYQTSNAVSPAPTSGPTEVRSVNPTQTPTIDTTHQPSLPPTSMPLIPTPKPSLQPSVMPTTKSPTVAPSFLTFSPTSRGQTPVPSSKPTTGPPSLAPSTSTPTNEPTPADTSESSFCANHLDAGTITGDLIVSAINAQTAGNAVVIQLFESFGVNATSIDPITAQIEGLADSPVCSLYFKDQALNSAQKTNAEATAAAGDAVIEGEFTIVEQAAAKAAVVAANASRVATDVQENLAQETIDREKAAAKDLNTSKAYADSEVSGLQDIVNEEVAVLQSTRDALNAVQDEEIEGVYSMNYAETAAREEAVSALNTEIAQIETDIDGVASQSDIVNATDSLLMVLANAILKGQNNTEDASGSDYDYVSGLVRRLGESFTPTQLVEMLMEVQSRDVTESSKSVDVLKLDVDDAFKLVSGIAGTLALASLIVAGCIWCIRKGANGLKATVFSDKAIKELNDTATKTLQKITQGKDFAQQVGISHIERGNTRKFQRDSLQAIKIKYDETEKALCLDFDNLQFDMPLTNKLNALLVSRRQDPAPAQVIHAAVIKSLDGAFSDLEYDSELKQTVAICKGNKVVIDDLQTTTHGNIRMDINVFLIEESAKTGCMKLLCDSALNSVTFGKCKPVKADSQLESKLRSNDVFISLGKIFANSFLEDEGLVLPTASGGGPAHQPAAQAEFKESHASESSDEIWL